MSLDVYLDCKEKIKGASPREAIFVRGEGSTYEVSRETWDEMFPGQEPVTVTVDDTESCRVFSHNITHNLNTMAKAAGIYKELWRPDEIGITKAKQLIAPLQKGLETLKKNPAKFKKFNPENGWGDYEGLCEFVVAYLEAAMQYPDAEVSVWR